MSWTSIFLIVAVVAIVIFDVYVIMKKGKAESISAYIIRGSKKYPLLVLLTGIVLGHLFWSMSPLDWMYREDAVNLCRGYLNDK